MTFVWRSSSTSASCAVLFLRLVSLLTLPDLRIVDSFAVEDGQRQDIIASLPLTRAVWRQRWLERGEQLWMTISWEKIAIILDVKWSTPEIVPVLADSPAGTLPKLLPRLQRQIKIDDAAIADMLVALGTTFGSLCSPQTANAAAAIAASKPIKSRSEGYEVRHTKAEWTSMLSGAQCNVLRRGGTERQRSSILENEKRPGLYVCAGCQRPLFTSAAKFSSGTGWPSFDAPVDANAVEVESIGTFQAAVDGAEVRCQTCGGHLGDVFGDGGWRYGTKTGKRYCINGAALVFRPEGEGESEVRGDIPPPNKVIQYEQVLRREPVV
eukprot:CAMPEP_0181042602 /NCGR_PEP_ID=MMETSP1070-20121207/12242_1 /TAXON_ID=265543 /ORGANISM="Minutocellus polymorphus, Strain NH13" /LENGTH=323 /DNA_ID=CAMNT_0023120835 /DNA_START=113 /DNA_END=1084 /DNA_ORIENTATION=-